MPIVTRTEKGLPLTHAELDGNFTELKAQVDNLLIMSNPFDKIIKVTPRFVIQKASATLNKVKIFRLSLPDHSTLTADWFGFVQFEFKELAIYDDGTIFSTSVPLGYMNIKFTYSTQTYSITAENISVSEGLDKYKIDLTNNEIIFYYEASYESYSTTQLYFAFMKNTLVPEFYDTFDFVETV